MVRTRVQDKSPIARLVSHAGTLHPGTASARIETFLYQFGFRNPRTQLLRLPRPNLALLCLDFSLFAQLR
ncbi:hypothetical protein GCM10027419_31550 [Pandoraea terrae]